MLYQGVLYRGTTVITDIQQLQGFAVQKKTFFLHSYVFCRISNNFHFFEKSVFSMFFKICFSKHV